MATTPKYPAIDTSNVKPERTIFEQIEDKILDWWEDLRERNPNLKTGPLWSDEQNGKRRE